ncbi:carbohydrate ABC transporter permease [Candidatus Sumerlaeota bacterium]|nr:carbohydrate ABC transporter permease [Candidatus Sumerlaeota bacterium]
MIVGEPRRRIGTHAVLIIACAIAIFPIHYVLITSFKPEADVYTPQIVPAEWHPENYHKVVSTDGWIFARWFLNSVVVALGTTAIGLFFASTAAFALSRFKFRGRNASLTLFLITQMFPGAILLVPLYAILRSMNLLDSYLGLILVYTTVALPFCIWMLKGYYDTIPFTLDEAAIVDGLSVFGVFWRIVTPLALPGMAVTAFFSFITAWNEFMFALVFMVGDAHKTLPVGLQSAYMSQHNIQWNLMAAGSVMITLPVIIMFVIAQRYIVSGLTQGGVKG